ncbi:MAG: hypothetical protein LCI02_28295 [Proteobacteria bacterium]|nr:hypothetical protein [Pseudomonadota bacterium]
MSDRDDGVHVVASGLLLTAGGFLALSVQSSLPLWLALAAAVFVVFCRWHTQPLAPLTSKQVTASRIAEAGLWTLLLASMFG